MPNSIPIGLFLPPMLFKPMALKTTPPLRVESELNDALHTVRHTVACYLWGTPTTYLLSIDFIVTVTPDKKKKILFTGDVEHVANSTWRLTVSEKERYHNEINALKKKHIDLSPSPTGWFNSSFPIRRDAYQSLYPQGTLLVIEGNPETSQLWSSDDVWVTPKPFMEALSNAAFINSLKKALEEQRYNTVIFYPTQSDSKFVRHKIANMDPRFQCECDSLSARWLRDKVTATAVLNMAGAPIPQGYLIPQTDSAAVRNALTHLPQGLIVKNPLASSGSRPFQKLTPSSSDKAITQALCMAATQETPAGLLKAPSYGLIAQQYKQHEVHGRTTASFYNGCVTLVRTTVSSHDNTEQCNCNDPHLINQLRAWLHRILQTFHSLQGRPHRLLKPVLNRQLKQVCPSLQLIVSLPQQINAFLILEFIKSTERDALDQVIDPMVYQCLTQQMVGRTSENSQVTHFVIRTFLMSITNNVLNNPHPPTQGLCHLQRLLSYCSKNNCYKQATKEFETQRKKAMQTHIAALLMLCLKQSLLLRPANEHDQNTPTELKNGHYFFLVNSIGTIQKIKGPHVFSMTHDLQYCWFGHPSKSDRHRENTPMSEKTPLSPQSPAR